MGERMPHWGPVELLFVLCCMASWSNEGDGVCFQLANSSANESISILFVVFHGVCELFVESVCYVFFCVPVFEGDCVVFWFVEVFLFESPSSVFMHAFGWLCMYV